MSEVKEKITFSNIIQFIIGRYRYKLYYSKFNFLIRNHIKEQIDWRIEIMDDECLTNGSCKLCGCDTTALQMANKACNKPCYPKMMNKSAWKSIGRSLKLLEKKNKFKFNQICHELERDEH